ncbi:MAG: hypothetical protein IPK12_17805 [Gemmatimonadetes bacterium]|nr:hypothetical protein [Gemmatimonadota bacterium]
MSKTLRVAAAALGFLLCGALDAPMARPVCTVIAAPPAKRTGNPYFLGRALADTTLAGPGGARLSEDQGHFGPSGARAIYGQVMEVERAGGVALPFPLPRGQRVVVVPWDYDAACETVAWGRSARWLEPGPLRFVHASLRPREQWLGGLPTLDAFSPAGASSPSDHRNPVAMDGTPPVTPAVWFDLFEVMPSQESVAVLGEAALAPVRAWAEAHKAIAFDLPVSAVLYTVVEARDRARQERFTMPMAGTYQVTFLLPDGVTRQLAFRTFTRSYETWYSDRWYGDESPLTVARLFEGGAGVGVWYYKASTPAALREPSPPLRAAEGLPQRSWWPWALAWDSLPDGTW